MIKQTVSYGVWTLNRHDDNKIEVLKNGQVCEKASPAYREIAAEIGFEIDPEWRTSQLGRNVFKAVENVTNSSCSSTTASTPVEEKKTSATEQDPAPKKTISEDKNTQPIQEVSQNETISVFDVILQSKGENALQVVKAVKEQLGIGLGEAKELVDAAPSTIAIGVDRSAAKKIKSKLESEGAEVKINFVKLVNVEDTEEIYSLCINNHIEALEWVCTKCCKSRMYHDFWKLVRYSEDSMRNRFINNLEKLGWSDAGFVTNHNALQVLAITIFDAAPDAISGYEMLIEKKLLHYIIYIPRVCKKFTQLQDYIRQKDSNIERFSKILYHLCLKSIYTGEERSDAIDVLYKMLDENLNWDYFYPINIEKHDIDKTIVYDSIRIVLSSLKTIYNPIGTEQYNSGINTLKQMNEKHKVQYEKLKSEKEKYERWWREDYNKAKALEQELERYKSQSSSSSSSSARSSRDENVQVRIKYTTDSNMWHLIHGSGGVVTMTRSEYKKLMNDSLKGRTAFVRAKFGISSSFKITGVDISLV